MNTLKNKLITSYALLSLIIIFGISVLSNIMLERLFEEYAIKKQQNNIANIVKQVGESYDEFAGSFNQASLEIIGNAALQNGLIIHIKGVKGEIDWDMRQHNQQQCQLMLQHAENNMHSIYTSFKGAYLEDSYVLESNKKYVGDLYFGYYGPYSFSDEETYLIGTINKVLLSISGSALLLAISLGIFMARRITVPISKVVSATRIISKGTFGTQVSSKSSTKEIKELVASINELSDELNKMDMLKKRLSADVAHELRTPLTILQSHVEALIDGVWEPKGERLQRLYDELERLANLADDLQNLFNIEDAEIVLDKKWFNMSNFTKTIHMIFEAQLDKKSIQFDYTGTDNDEVYADYDRLKQVMINLISNAIKYTPERGKITVHFFTEPKAFIITVTDTGCGMPPNELPYIFERFYRVDPSRARLTGGSGIGLTIVKTLIAAHAGDISVESAVEKGSTFKITLPKTSE